ncbi:autolytic lysozyme [Clostridium homopropionicum DSM 5847]|uniref:Autolytic lysozyme n=1 Tax=Clostridium homopropionicum DSM 5847 TaxID=1121318 RepID=A0A0L6Z8L6_9CLOT|nr:glycoside hydrolase family 25 protein [Clostridium homopropionicum]KOA19315.1 autolytic lysozyme [Clostridium homopropionicum DSM 5847]SFG20802.1 Glycosyl hydrolases family 25 [Clostridium homopropionicum]
MYKRNRLSVIKKVMAIFLICCCILTVSGYKTYATTPKVGIDVSNHNGVINWDQVKASGISYAILRVGFGDNYTSQDDTQFANNVAGCIANNIPYAVYLYSYATNLTGSSASIDSEIAHVKRLISGKNPFAVYIDMEDSSTVYLGKTTLTSFATRFCDSMIASGYKAGVYANTYWFNNNLDATTLFNKGYSIWVAEYNTTCNYTKTPYDMWQYTSSGSVPGISTSVDKNYMYNDITNGGSSNQGTIDVTYQTYDDVNNTWLPNVVNTSDYAGIFGHDVTGVYANLSSGNIYYKVHVKGGSWLPEVANRSDYAGILTSPIDGLMVKTDTGKTIHYRVHLRTTGAWLPYVTGYNTADSNNGYAGIYGNEIDAIQMYLD